jgi:hypothetical protein
VQHITINDSDLYFNYCEESVRSDEVEALALSPYLCDKQ